jgi:hypothetical protein
MVVVVAAVSEVLARCTRFLRFWVTCSGLGGVLGGGGADEWWWSACRFDGELVA